MYIGARVWSLIYGYGRVIDYYGEIGPHWLVQFDNPHDNLHDGNGYCKGKDNCCWYYDYGEITIVNDYNSIAFYLNKKE